MPNEGVPNEAALNPKPGLSSFPLSNSTPNFVLSTGSFVVDILPLIVDPAEPKTGLGELEIFLLEPAIEVSVVPMLLAGFSEGSNGTAGFATDGVAKENDDAALGGLLIVNLNTLGDGALDGEGPNGDPLAALVFELRAVLWVVVVLAGGGPNLEAIVGTDFSANDDAFLGAARLKKEVYKNYFLVNTNIQGRTNRRKIPQSR